MIFFKCLNSLSKVEPALKLFIKNIQNFLEGFKRSEELE